MVAEIEEALPDYFSAYGAPYEVDMGSAIEKGRVVNRRFQFGNMVLSRTPILASRNLLLPRMRTYDILNLQRGALEALIATRSARSASIRFISTIRARRSVSCRSAGLSRRRSPTQTKAARSPAFRSSDFPSRRTPRNSCSWAIST